MHFPGQETVNEDSVNHISDGGVDLPGQEMVNGDTESSDASQLGGVRRGRRNRTSREMHVPLMQVRHMLKENMRGVDSPG